MNVNGVAKRIIRFSTYIF